MLYAELLCELEENADSTYREFHKKLLKNDNINVLGVKVPILRKIAKKHKGEFNEIFLFPDEFYEVKFIKLSQASELEYEEFINILPKCVELIDNWALCDCFSPKCIAKNRDKFLPQIYNLVENGGEFAQRFALTTLLKFYIDKDYMETVLTLMLKCDTSYFYVHMAAAWLTAEIIIKDFEFGQTILKNSLLDKKTHNKAIVKSCESFRLSDEEKQYLKGFKR